MRDHIPDRVGHRLTIADTISQPPYATPAGHPAVESLAEAMSQAWGRPVGRMGNAGSGPAALLAERTGAPVLFFGTGLPEDRWHSSDESLQLGASGSTAPPRMALFWPELAADFSPCRVSSMSLRATSTRLPDACEVLALPLGRGSPTAKPVQQLA